jgi:cytochrome P450
MGQSIGSLAEGLPVAPQVSGPRFRTPFGFLAAMRRDPLTLLTSWHRRYGDVVEIRFTPFRSFLFVHPDHIRHILQENHRNYWKGIVFQKLKRIAGEGLVFSDGPLWRRQRQLIQPAFHRERIAGLGSMMVEKTTALLERWQPHVAEGRPLDVADEMSALTLEIVAAALFGTDLGDDTHEFTDAVSANMTYANHLMNHFFNPPLFVPTAANRRGRRALARLDRVVSKVIEQRRREGVERPDLLGMLIAARDAETNEAMDDKQLRDEIVTFLVAGHETTAVALSWTWYLLSRHPEVEERLREEVRDAIGGRAATMADLPKLAYTRMVLEEAMRLYPPAWATNREAYADDEVGGVSIKGRTTVILSPYVTHRHPEFWEDPERFDPERFLPERSAGRPEYAYFPFGGGPRGCVGRQFAMMEAQLIVATIAQRFRLRVVPNHPVEPYPILTLRPRHGIPVTVEPSERGAH